MMQLGAELVGEPVGQFGGCGHAPMLRRRADGAAPALLSADQL